MILPVLNLVFYVKVVQVDGLRMFENRILWRIVGPGREAGGNYLYFSLDIIRMIKSRKMRGAQVSHILLGYVRNAYNV
jgi:hypothetical protein